MTAPTRDALHAETETWIRNKRDTTTGGERSKRILAYAAECVKRVPELEAELDKWREREASVCPEDFGFEEVIKTLRAEVERLRAIVRDFALSPIEHQDPRIEWVTMQIERDLLAAATREGTDA